jgi:prepilin-type N-terminal cleavage/methylation domain-containing protein
MNVPMGPRNPRSEAGFALIEVIVAAAVLAIVALAVLSGIDGATASSTREKARAVAANLAEQDQERLRSMPVDQLRNPPQMNDTGDVTVDGVKYHVTSEAKFITDDLGGEPVCGTGSTQVQYLHVITTVTSAVAGTRIPAVSVDSLVSPTTDFAEGHGALGLKLLNRAGTQGAQGITVSATSPTYTPPNEVTDANGCAVFDGLPVGTYTLTVNQPGYVGRDLNQKATVNGTVVRKTVSFVQLSYDKAVTIRGTFYTHTPGKPFSATDLKPTTATYLSATNGINVGMLRTVTSTPAATTIDSAGLYPFTENMYAMFAGECKYASPDTYISNYFGQVNKDAALFGDPAKPQPQGATIYQPPFNVRVMYRSTGKDAQFNDSDIKVFAKLQKPASDTSSCDEHSYELYSMLWANNSSATWGSAPRNSSSSTVNPTYNKNHWLSSVATTFDPGMPFGKYRLCVIDTVAHKYGRTSSTALYDNTAADGSAGGLDVTIGTWSSYSSSIAKQDAGPTNVCGFSS